MVLAAPRANLKNLAGSERFKQNKKSPAALHVWELWNCVRFMNKEQGWEKKQLLLKRRSLSPSCPPAFWVLDKGSSPSPGTHHGRQQLRLRTRGPPARPAAEGMGARNPALGPPWHIQPAPEQPIQLQPCSQTRGSCHWQTQRSVPGMGASLSCSKNAAGPSEGQAQLRVKSHPCEGGQGTRRSPLNKQPL